MAMVAQPIQKDSVLNPIADKYGFAVCYPQGEQDKKGKNCWNVGYPFQADMTIDDINFLCDLALYLQKNYRLSPHNTFCTGYSNGGEMCYLLAYKRPDIFTAVAPVAGLTLEWIKVSGIRNKPPYPSIRNTRNRRQNLYVERRTTNNEGGWGKYIAVPIAVNYWAIQNEMHS